MATITLKNKIMKTYISILVLFLFACSSNNQLQRNTSNCNFNDKISENEKIINIESYKKQLYKEGSFKLIENETIIDNVSNNSNGYNRRIYNKINDVIKLINYDTITNKINYSNFYYNKGNFNIGNEYIYNEQGQVIQTIDHNQYNKYPICYKEIIKIALKKAGRKYFLHALSRDSITINNELNYAWHISLSDTISKYPEIISKFYKLNSKTGKILKQGFVTESGEDYFQN
jgi:hypothetical protein